MSDVSPPLRKARQIIEDQKSQINDLRDVIQRSGARSRTPGHLSPAAHRILKLMLEAEQAEEYEDAELVCEGGQCWCGLERTSRAVVNELLRCALVGDVGEQGKGVERYALNQDGRRAALDVSYQVPELTGSPRRGS